MKRLLAYKKYSIFLLLLLCSANLIHAQIGVNTEKPIVTLDISSKTTDGTTAEGLLIPRLTLTELASKDSKYTSSHVGTLVYVTKIDGTATTQTSNVTANGFYSYDGTKWIKFGNDSMGLDFFYMPTIVLSIDKRDPSYNTTKSLFEVDLYTAYKNQFSLTNTNSSTKNPSGKDLIVYDSGKLNYLVTYYDKDVFKNMLITDEGLLTYELQDDIILTEKSFVNVMFNIK